MGTFMGLVGNKKNIEYGQSCTLTCDSIVSNTEDTALRMKYWESVSSVNKNICQIYNTQYSNVANALKNHI